MTENNLIYWDSCIFVAWLKRESDTIQIIEPIASMHEESECTLITSVILYPEILEGSENMPKDAIKRFDDFMKRKGEIILLPVDLHIAKKAQSIRNNAGVKISTPDAIHLATAIVSRAEVFHTFDKGLLRLSGKPEVEGLAITECTL